MGDGLTRSPEVRWLARADQGVVDHGGGRRFAGGPGHADHAPAVQALHEQPDLRGHGDTGRLGRLQVTVFPRLGHGRVGDHQVAAREVGFVVVAELVSAKRRGEKRRNRRSPTDDII